MKLRIKQLLIAIGALLLGTNAFAHDFEVDGIYYNFLSSNTVKVTFEGSTYKASSDEYTGTVTIPSTVTSSETTYSVTEIDNNAFKSCSELTSVTSLIPADNLFAIDSYVFNKVDKSACTLYVPFGAKDTYASTDGWNEFTNIVEIEGQGGQDEQNKCGDSAYWSLNEETGVLTISGTGAIYDFGYGNSPWANNSNIKSVEIENGITTIGGCSFISCSELTSVTIPNSVTTIGESAFYYCSSLTSVTIPDSVTEIGAYAFSGCSGLTSVSVGNSTTSIGDYAFYCSGLTSIEIPNSVTEIGQYAFIGCSGLTSVTIGNSVTEIGNNAFAFCYELTSVTSLIPADNLFAIDSSVFGDVDKSACTLHVPSGAKDTYASTSGWNEFTNIVDPDELNKCGDSAYWSFNEETGVLTISGTGAMYDFEYKGSPWYNIISDIKSVEIENGITTIGNEAFANCSGLTSVTIPNSVTEIGESAFEGCTGLTSVTIPNSVTKIDNYAFYYCTGVTEVSIGNSVSSIGDNAFQSCTGLTEVTFGNSVTKIGYGAFSDCPSLTSVTIPDSVTEIGESAFEGCTGLTSVTIPNSVTKIGDYAFFGCDNLVSVTIGNSVTEIGNWAFFDCPGLTSVTIPNSVTKIGDYAFFGCDNLVSVTIGNSVTEIGPYAFTYCYELASITSLIPADNLFAIESSVFNGVDKSACTLYVPFGAKDTYAATSGWSEFFNIEELPKDYSGVDTINLDNGAVNDDADAVYYDLYGRRVTNPSNGIYIVNGKKVYIK